MSGAAPFVPSVRGRAAIGALDRVPWGELAHAYGTGVSGPGRHEDLRGTLARLGDDDIDATDDAVDLLFSNVCHQGTIYAATAHAVPFIAAVAAGPEVWVGDVAALVVLLGHIAIASGFETHDGTMSGSFGEGVDVSTRAGIRASAALLSAIGSVHAPLAALCTAIVRLAEADPPARAHLDAVAAALDVVGALEHGDRPRPAQPQPWVSHPKFGLGQIIAREDAKARVRFVDGTERTLLARVLLPADPPSEG